MELEFIDVHFRRRGAVSVDPKVCAGCRTCEVICSMVHEGAIDLEKARIIVKQDPFKGSFVPNVCRQCSDAPCYYACPESAIRIEESQGIVLIDGEKCTGCHSCEKACPFRVIRFDEGKNKAFKCDFCGGDPKCVEWCPVNALGVVQFGGGIGR